MDVQQTRQQRGGRYRVPNPQESRVASCGSGRALLTVPIFAVYTAQDTISLQAFWMDGRVRHVPWLSTRNVWRELFGR